MLVKGATGFKTRPRSPISDMDWLNIIYIVAWINSYFTENIGIHLLIHAEFIGGLPKPLLNVWPIGVIASDIKH